MHNVRQSATSHPPACAPRRVRATRRAACCRRRAAIRRARTRTALPARACRSALRPCRPPLARRVVASRARCAWRRALLRGKGARCLAARCARGGSAPSEWILRRTARRRWAAQRSAPTRPAAAAAGRGCFLHRPAGRQRRVAPGRSHSKLAQVRGPAPVPRPTRASRPRLFHAPPRASGSLRPAPRLARARAAARAPCASRLPCAFALTSPARVPLGATAAQRRRGRHPHGHDVRHRVRRGVPRGGRAAVRGALRSTAVCQRHTKASKRAAQLTHPAPRRPRR